MLSSYIGTWVYGLTRILVVVTQDLGQQVYRYIGLDDKRLHRIQYAGYRLSDIKGSKVTIKNSTCKSL